MTVLITEKILELLSKQLLSDKSLDLIRQNPEMNLLDAGLNSVTAISLLFEIENTYEITFKPHMLQSSLFSSLNHLSNIVESLLD